MTFKVYLAGPITGLTYGEAESWRDYIRTSAHRLDNQIKWYSPLRQQEHLREQGVLIATYSDDNPMTSRHGIMTRDAWDVRTCDLMFCNLLGATKVSVGTVMELGMAFAWNKPTVLVMEKHGNVHEHVMVDNALTFRTDNLDAGIRLTADILLP